MVQPLPFEILNLTSHKLTLENPMTKFKLTLATFTILATFFLAGPSLLATDTQTLQGEFVWERPDEKIVGALEAVFEATGKETWNVSFHFTFDEKDHVYAGTAEGSLMDGELHGRVMTDGENPSPFEFEGTFSEGSFNGTHASLRDGEPQPTGTMTLSH